MRFFVQFSSLLHLQVLQLVSDTTPYRSCNYHEFQCEEPKLRYVSLPFKPLTFIDNPTEAKEPAFLQRLKSQYGGENSRENPQRRPKRLRNDDDDDAPTYVEEGSNEVISKEEYDALVRGDDPKDPEADENGTGQTEAASNEAVLPKTAKGEDLKSRQNVAGIGGPKKRKQGKVVGDEAAGEEEEEGVDRQEQTSVANKPKQKKKKKKVKLSFDEPEGD